MEDTIAIDGTGRVVIPQAIRRSLGLRAGSQLRIRVDGGAIVLEAVPDVAQFERVGRLLIASGGGGDVVDHRTLRAERLAKVAGG